jgi:hypothetical protein
MAYAQLNYIVGDEVVKKSDIYTFRVMDSLTGEGDPPEAYESWLEHLTHLAAQAMAEALDIEGIVTDKTLTVDGGIADGKATGDALALKADKSTTYTKAEVDQMIEDVEVETDTTLAIAGAPADAKKVGDELSALKADLDALEPGLSDTAKAALLACFSHVMWADKNGQNLYNDLYKELYGQEPEPLYDIRNIEYAIGGGGPAFIYSWSGNTKTNTYTCLFRSLELANRAMLRSFMPAVSGTITAMPDYEIAVYTFDSIQFDSNWYYNPKTNAENQFGTSGAVNFNTSTPGWVQSYTIEDSDCKFVLLCFRKKDGTDWTQSELQNMYGTVYTASFSPSYRLSEIADFKGGYSYTMGNIVKNESVTEIGFSTAHTRTYVAEVSTSARAVSGFLPITNGIFRSADTSKYQICVYQINDMGQIMWDHNNPYVSETNGNPAWANEFDLSISANKDAIFCVCISFKKLDGTEFTADELANMYGTVFMYEEV